jgi:hypothetical protein
MQQSKLFCQLIYDENEVLWIRPQAFSTKIMHLFENEYLSGKLDHFRVLRKLFVAVWFWSSPESE